jgi:diaminohydroxyphosphoribosylaminopyrimidine deaminase / 5-amino-6-(5-phosphoribosylamino)uracil reductase
VSGSADEVVWMARALARAERGRLTCRPNPMVGCVLVRDGEVVADGWHERAGGPHAEIAALTRAGDRAAGATAYVTLEPCNHHGRTGPCSEALLAAGVRRVVYGLADPNPAAAGGGARLRAAGVEVAGGLLAPWVAEQNRVFLHGLTHRRPHVTLKLAQTVDGALVAPAGRWITGPAARAAVHRERARADAVLVGSGTVLADDPRLDVRGVPAPGGQPRAVVLDARGRTPVDAAVVRPGTIVVTGPDAPADRRAALTAAGVEVVAVPAAAPAGVDLDAAFGALWDRGIRAILAEPGATLAAALMRAGVVDRLLRHVAGSVVAIDGTPRPAAAVATGAAWPVRRQVPRGDDVEIETVPTVEEAA